MDVSTGTWTTAFREDIEERWKWNPRRSQHFRSAQRKKQTQNWWGGQGVRRRGNFEKEEMVDRVKCHREV